MTTLEDEMNLELYALCIRILENERIWFTNRCKLSEKETIRLYEISVEIQNYETMIDELYMNQ
jgi:hypothetical protein